MAYFDRHREINSNTVIVGDCKTLLTSMNISFRLKINMETMALNDKLGQMDFTDIFRAFKSISSRIHILFKYMWNIF